MHEFSLCQNLLHQVDQIAREHQATTIDKIHLQVGPLSGVEPALLQTAFQIARTDTLARSADILIHMTPIKVRCKSCGATSEANMNNLACRDCGDWQTELISGDELLIERIEMQTPQ